MTTPEIGYCVFLTKEEMDEINAMLAEDGYPEGVEGIREFLLDAAGDDSPESSDKDSTSAKFRKAFSSPEAQEALRMFGPVAGALLRRAAAKL